MTVGPVRDIEVGDDRVGVSAVRQIDKRNGRDCLVVGQVVGTGHQGCPESAGRRRRSRIPAEPVAHARARNLPPRRSHPAAQQEP